MSTTGLTPAKAALIAIVKRADELKREFAAIIEPHGITAQQFNVLRILRGAGPEGLCTLTIAERMIEQAPGITRLIDRLERKQLVRRVRSEEDRRQVWIRITPEGQRLLAGLDDAVEEFDAAAVRGLSTAELEQITTLLGSVAREPA